MVGRDPSPRAHHQRVKTGKMEKEERDPEQPLAEKAQHDATLLQHLVKRHTAGARSLHGLHKARHSQQI